MLATERPFTLSVRVHGCQCLKSALASPLYASLDLGRLASFLEVCLLGLGVPGTDTSTTYLQRVSQVCAALQWGMCPPDGPASALPNWVDVIVRAWKHPPIGTRSADQSKIAALLDDANTMLETTMAATQSSRAAVHPVIACPKCRTHTGIAKVTQQTRSADEGMCTRCHCTTCGAQWTLA